MRISQDAQCYYLPIIFAASDLHLQRVQCFALNHYLSLPMIYYLLTFMLSILSRS